LLFESKLGLKHVDRSIFQPHRAYLDAGDRVNKEYYNFDPTKSPILQF